MEIDCPYTTLWITAQDNNWDHFYVHAAAEHPKDGAEWVGFFRDSHGMEGFLRGMQTANDKMLAELSHTKDENAKLRAELAEAVELLEGIGDFANMEVIDVGAYVQEGGVLSGDFDDVRQWQRIVDFLGKRGFYNTTA